MAYIGIGDCEECGFNAEYDEAERMNNEEILEKLNATIAELKALLYKARTIITRYESKHTPDLYICDCNSKNKQSVQEFFEQVLKFHDDFPE